VIITSFAQNKKVLDSLLIVYNTAKQDTTRIIALNFIGFEYRNSKPDTCITIAEETIKRSEKINYSKGIALGFNNLGNVAIIKGNHPLALDYLQQSIKIYEKIKDKQGIATGLNNVGIIYRTQGNYPLALEYYLKSLKIYEGLNNKQGMSMNLNNIGNIYYFQNNYPSALEYHQKSLTIREELNNKEGIATSFNNIGDIYLKQKNYPLALEYFQKSLKIREEIKDKQGIATNLNNIGDIYKYQGNFPLALDYYHKSLQIKKEVGKKTALPYTLNGLAEVYRKEKNYEKSIEYAQEGLKIAQEIKALSEIKMLSETLYKTYKLRGDYAEALTYFELAKQTGDSLFNIEKTKSIANLESRFLLDKKEKEFALLAKDNELNKLEAERQRNARLIIEKQAEADHLLALARQEKDKRKQDSLRVLAQKVQLEAENLKAQEKLLLAETKTKQLEIWKQKETNAFQQKINYLTLFSLVGVVLFASFVFYSRVKLQASKHLIEQQKNAIEKQNTELKIQSQELDEANQSKDKLFAILGHDLRSPINSLEGILDLINTGILTPQEFKDLAPQFHKNVKNMQMTLENLLQWAISQMQGLSASPSKVNLYELADKIVQLFTPTAHLKNLRLVLEISPELMVWADPNHVRLLFRNLINNAIKFTPDGGIIKVAATPKDKWIEISVIDNGVGMKEEVLAKLFKKNQGFTTYGTKGEKGTGLGLPLCQEIVHKNGGDIWATSSPGKGSSFCFSLPAYEPVVQEKESQTTSKQANLEV
jgi:signal transduction histidine kinase